MSSDYSNIRTTAQSAQEGRLKVDAAGILKRKKKRAFLKKAVKRSY